MRNPVISKKAKRISKLKKPKAKKENNQPDAFAKHWRYDAANKKRRGPLKQLGDYEHATSCVRDLQNKTDCNIGTHRNERPKTNAFLLFSCSVEKTATKNRSPTATCQYDVSAKPTFKAVDRIQSLLKFRRSQRITCQS